jgi:hypothetical protein
MNKMNGKWIVNLCLLSQNVLCILPCSVSWLQSGTSFQTLLWKSRLGGDCKRESDLSWRHSRTWNSVTMARCALGIRRHTLRLKLRGLGPKELQTILLKLSVIHGSQPSLNACSSFTLLCAQTQNCLQTSLLYYFIQVTRVKYEY